MKGSLFAAVLLLGASLPRAWADSNPVAKLEHIPVFALGGIGYAGTMSEGERALRALLREPRATAELEELLHSATPAGRLYALLGLRLHDRASYARALQTFQKPEVEVETIGGCTVWHAPFRELLQRIEAGVYNKSLARPDW